MIIEQVQVLEVLAAEVLVLRLELMQLLELQTQAVAEAEVVLMAHPQVMVVMVDQE